MKGKLGSAITNLTSAKELLGFVWRGRTWWLTPLVLVLALLTFLVIFLEGSALAPSQTSFACAEVTRSENGPYFASSARK